MSRLSIAQAHLARTRLHAGLVSKPYGVDLPFISARVRNISSVSLCKRRLLSQSSASCSRQYRAFDRPISSSHLDLQSAVQRQRRQFSSSDAMSGSQMQVTLHNNRTAAPVKRLADSLEKPDLDTRTYRVVQLPNKLEALLIHDADTDKASAAMDVNVGSFSDEEDMPGMAHAVEHLLFMGTEKVWIVSIN